MDSKACQAMNSEGQPCQARPVLPSGFCYWHCPDQAEKRRRNNAKGGANRSNAKRAKKVAAAAGIKTIPDLQRLLSQAIDDALATRVSPTLLNALAGASKAIVDLGQAHELEARLQALETAAGLDERRRA